MALNPNCADLTVAYFSSPSTAGNAATSFPKAPHKTLIVDYVPGLAKQSWYLDGLRGQGDPAEIAADVCFALSERGAKIVE